MGEIKAIIFDMDGVILDSESICDVVWEMTAREKGLEGSSEVINLCRGTNKNDTIQILKNFYGQNFDAEYFLNRSSELFHEVENTKGVPLMPYAKETLEALKGKFRIALASSTRVTTVRRQLGAHNLLPFFETMTTGEMVEHSKPDPEIYLMACRSLGLEPEECVAVEDSFNGIKSAHAAGMKCCMIPDKVQPTDEIRAMCDWVCGDLWEMKKVFNNFDLENPKLS